MIITKHLDYFVRQRFTGFKILHILQRGLGNFGKRFIGKETLVLVISTLGNS